MVNHEISKFIKENTNKHFCHCGCNNYIIITKYHYYDGIPKFIKNHGRKGKNHPLYGKVGAFKGHKHTNESKQKISQKNRYCIPWNKGLTSDMDDRIICGDKHSSKRFEFKDNLSKSRYGKNNPMFNKFPKYSKRCFYDSILQGKIYLNSSYELSYIKWLDSQKILWYYEYKTFDLGYTTYTPDFFLPETNEFIEIKGYMRKEAQEKIDKFLQLYPKIIFKILYKEDLIKLGINL